MRWLDEESIRSQQSTVESRETGEKNQMTDSRRRPQDEGRLGLSTLNSRLSTVRPTLRALPRADTRFRKMASGTGTALTIIRVVRGQPAPAEDVLRAAIAQDRQRLHLPPQNHPYEIAVAGPFAVSVDGRELDEYLAWER